MKVISRLYVYTLNVQWSSDLNFKIINMNLLVSIMLAVVRYSVTILHFRLNIQVCFNWHKEYVSKKLHTVMSTAV